MEFFDKKQDVIHIELTQFGRHVLSKGLFKPEYYAFFDDNIIYDTRVLSGSEIQNDSEERIKSTQRMKPQITNTSLEKEFFYNYSQMLEEDANAQKKSFQRTAERNYFLPAALGTSKVNSPHAPAWSVEFLQGHLSGSSKNLKLTGSHGGETVLPIPQLETDVTIKFESTDAPEIEPEEMEDGTEMSSTTVLLDDEDSYTVFLKIVEENGVFQKENFDIEIYEVTEEVKNNETLEFLRPLSFSQINTEEDQLAFLDKELPVYDKNFTDYYFDIFVDEEIDEETICEFDSEDTKLGVFADSKTKICEDSDEGTKVFDIYEDESDSPEDC